MTDQTVPRTSIDIASELETETGKLKACIGLINQTLQFRYKEADDVARAQGQLFLLTDLLGEMQERLATLTADVYAKARAEKVAA